MKLLYLPTAFPDIVWMRHYYRGIFPQGAKRAREQLFAVERLIMDNPEIGRRVPGGREFPILRTPFSIVYRLRGDTIEIARVWDSRRNPDDRSF
jgi:plasmid stabilization system protein ParE